jgi:ribosomal protein S18 acetylase RimI-like enzyme
LKIEGLTYITKTATEKDIYLHLNKCNNSFVPPLNTRINIADYAKKIFNNAVTFEAWREKELIGLIAIYFNKETNIGFITNVSVMKEYMGSGIASNLIKMCIEYAEKFNYNEIKLEVYKDNKPAVNFYKKYNFTQIETKNDSLIMNHFIKYK